MAIEFEYGPSGFCPVQAEGTFDGVPFYFRARGTSVTVDVGDGWCWTGPEYEWPHAGYLSERTAMAFIADAYEAWQTRNVPSTHKTPGALKADNDRRDRAFMYIALSVELERALGEDAKPVKEWLMAQAGRMMKRKEGGDDTT